MTDVAGTPAYRPVLFGRTSLPRPIAPPRGGGGEGRIRFTDQQGRAQRLDRQMDQAAQAFRDSIALTESVQAADPELVLVFEALDERTDLSGIAQRLQLELLVEVESSIDPDDEVQLRSDRAIDPQIGSCLHAVCLTQSAMDRILAAWRSWRATGTVEWGLGTLGELFAHLRDVHPWGPEDRLRTIDWDEYFDGHVVGASHFVEIELWYRASNENRAAAIARVIELVDEAGGSVLGTSEQSEIGYLALKCDVPDSLLRAMASGDYEPIKLIKASDVLFLKVQGQGLASTGPDLDASISDGELPDGNARVLLLDGVPVANHERLRGRIQVADPDDLESDAPIGLRKHGTSMASALVWGDIAASERPLARPVIVRPVLVPSPASVDNVEEFPPDVFVPDLMRRVFEEHFSGDDNGLTIVNLSLGDPALPFESIMSSWARTLDWLSWQYGVLVVVSAGNYRVLPLPSGFDSDALVALSAGDRSAAIHAAQFENWGARRMLAPAESVNAITVGAVHDDASGAPPVGYVFDPHDGRIAPSPVSGLGGGHRRAIKPDVVAPGGRIMFGQPPIPSHEVAPAPSSLYGIRVASPTIGKETQIGGTSPAAALISRQLSGLVDLAEEVVGRDLSRHERVVAAKAMLVHGAHHPGDFDTGDLPLRHAIGYGTVDRNLAEGCEGNEATILYLGELGNLEEQDLEFPLPNGLSTRDIKRVTATLAWLSPVNWRHRQYRRAHLSFAKPTGLTNLPAATDVADSDAGRGSATVKHQSWEFDRAVAVGRGDSFVLKVKCHQQAGGLQDERVPFAAAITLWVSPNIGIDIYSQVAQQVRASVPIRPGS